MENINKYLQLKFASYTGLIKSNYEFKYNKWGYRYIHTWEYVEKNKFEYEIYWPDIFWELNWMWGYWFKWGWLGKFIRSILQDKPKHGE